MLLNDSSNIMVVNPFVRNVIIRGKRIIYQNKDGLKEDSGNVVEDNLFVRLYINEANNSRLKNLSHTSLYLLNYIFIEIISGEDYIQLGYGNVTKVLKMSKDTYSKAISDLKTNDIIRDKEVKKGLYWINPLVFFKGDRIKKYKNQVKERDWIVRTNI
jgi:hypothetical protein